MSWLSDLFETRVEGRGWEQVPLTSSERAAISSLQRIGTTPYKSPTRRIAPATETERFGFDLLGDYARTVPEGYELGGELAKKWATTPVDVTKIPEFRGVLNKIIEQGQLETGRLGRGLQRTGMATSSPGRDILGRSITGTQERMVGALAPFAEAERGRQFGAISLVGQFAEAEDRAVQERLASIQKYTLQRDLIQQGFDAEHAAAIADIAIALDQERMRLQAAAAVLGRQGYEFDPGTSSPSVFSKVAGIFS